MRRPVSAVQAERLTRLAKIPSSRASTRRATPTRTAPLASIIRKRLRASYGQSRLARGKLHGEARSRNLAERRRSIRGPGGSRFVVNHGTDEFRALEAAASAPEVVPGAAVVIDCPSAGMLHGQVLRVHNA